MGRETETLLDALKREVGAAIRGALMSAEDGDDLYTMSAATREAANAVLAQVVGEWAKQNDQAGELLDALGIDLRERLSLDDVERLRAAIAAARKG